MTSGRIPNYIKQPRPGEAEIDGLSFSDGGDKLALGGQAAWEGPFFFNGKPGHPWPAWHGMCDGTFDRFLEFFLLLFSLLVLFKPVRLLVSWIGLMTFEMF